MLLVGKLCTCRVWDCRVGRLVTAPGTVDAPSLPDTINLGDVENRVKVIVLPSVVAATLITRTAQARSLVLIGYICRVCRTAQAGSLVWTGYICRVSAAQAGSLVLTGFICRVCPRSHRAVNKHLTRCHRETRNKLCVSKCLFK